MTLQKMGKWLVITGCLLLGTVVCGKIALGLRKDINIKNLT